jgi:hypothetical protein
VGRQIKIEFQGITVSNTRKTCLVCKKKGCLNCMTGNVKHGIMHHKECPCPSGAVENQKRSPIETLRDLGLELVGFRVIVSRGEKGPDESVATIKIKAGETEVHVASEGNGPVNALDLALRKALSGVLSDTSLLEKIQLLDYRVDVVDGNKGTAASIEVTIDFGGDRGRRWQTTAQSTDIIEASFYALVEGIVHGLGPACTSGHSRPESKASMGWP